MPIRETLQTTGGSETIRNSIKNTFAASAHSLKQWQVKKPEYAGSECFEYYDRVSRVYREIYAKYSSDYRIAEIQGLYPDRPFEYTTVHIRLADIVKTSGALEREFDNYKLITIAEKEFSYIRIGAKVKVMGNTWLVINTDNMSDGDKAVIQRCDTTWHYLDYYGNVCSEPMCVSTYISRANNVDSQTSGVIANGYFNVKMQYNEAVKRNIFHNARMILGSSAYRVTGFSDFINEFTDDDSTVNMIMFTIRYEEPNDAIDDMANRVAGGKTFDWEILLDGTAALKAGESMTLTPVSRRNDETVTGTEEYPVSYVWESSDEQIATMTRVYYTTDGAYTTLPDDHEYTTLGEGASLGPSGTVTAISEGRVEITCSLEQNPLKKAVFALEVTGAESTTGVVFDTTVPTELSLFETAQIKATYYENGEATDAAVTFVLSGPDDGAYSYTVNGNTLNIKCWAGSDKPLDITAIYGDYSAKAQIILQGL